MNPGAMKKDIAWGHNYQRQSM